MGLHEALRDVECAANGVEVETSWPRGRRGLRRSNGSLLGRAKLVVRCVDWRALVVAWRIDVKQPALIVGRVNVETSGLVDCVGPAGDALPRREPRRDGEGRGLRRLVEGSSKEQNKSSEDERAEAHGAVHHLVI